MKMQTIPIMPKYNYLIDTCGEWDCFRSNQDPKVNNEILITEFIYELLLLAAVILCSRGSTNATFCL